MKRTTVGVLLVIGLFWCGAASVLTTAQTAVPPSTVEAAEAEGAKFPKAESALEPGMYGEAFGAKERKCVDAETHVAARSGEFVAGAFDRHWHMGNSGRKVWWAPMQTATMPPMLLRASKIGAPEATVTWTFPSVVSNENGYFFNTTFWFPAVGKWLVVVTSGNNWGCFLLDEIDSPTGSR
jgi:hypothetical protein